MPEPPRSPSLSRRTGWARRPSRWVAGLAQARERGQDRFDLSETNPTRAGLLHPDAVYAALGTADARLYAPDPLGLLGARQAIADHYGGIDPDRVWLCSSTSEAYAQILTLLADPGDAVMVPRPGYPLLDVLGDSVGVVRVGYRVSYEGRWFIDTAELAAVAAAQTRLRAIVVVSPNNPTGNVATRAEREAIAACCRDRGCAEIVDEVFADYALDCPSVAPAERVATSAPLSLLVSGLSKVAALPQMKLSWVVVGGSDEARIQEALARARILADTFLSVATPVQLALPALLRAAPAMQTRIAARLRSNLGALRRATAGEPWEVLAVDAGWTALVRLPQAHALDDEGWALALLHRGGVVTTPGFLFDVPATPPRLAISLLGEPAAFELGVLAMRDTVSTILETARQQG